MLVYRWSHLRRKGKARATQKQWNISSSGERTDWKWKNSIVQQKYVKSIDREMDCTLICPYRSRVRSLYRPWLFCCDAPPHRSLCLCAELPPQCPLIRSLSYLLERKRDTYQKMVTCQPVSYTSVIHRAFGNSPRFIFFSSQLEKKKASERKMLAFMRSSMRRRNEIFVAIISDIIGN